MSDTLTAPGASAPASAEPDDYSGHATNTGISNPKLGMWVFLGSDCMLFGGLIATYMPVSYTHLTLPTLYPV